MLMFSFKPSATGFPMLVRSESELCAPSVPGLDALERLAVFDTKLIIDFDFATARSTSPDVSPCCLFDMVLGLLIRPEWLQENTEKTHDVEQTEKMVPLITGEITFRQQICGSWCQCI